MAGDKRARNGHRGAGRFLWLAAVVGGLYGCAGPSAWAPDPGVQMGAFPAAMSQCQVEADKLPVTQQAMAQPLFVAAAQQEFMIHCMKARGWHPA